MHPGNDIPSLDPERVPALIGGVRPSGAGYRDLAAALRAAIASGELPVGTRLPPQRELARLLSVGRTTVVAAYNLLRAESLIVMKQGAGTWVVRRP
jgi:DNA-binding GntR family transcriptional regulator